MGQEYLDGQRRVVSHSKVCCPDFVANQSRFQMVSLLKLANVTEEGVRFLSPHDGSPMYISPSQKGPDLTKLQVIDT